MADFFDTQGASASYYTSADYSGNFFAYAVDGTYDAYYVTRLADAMDHASATLTGNSIYVFGTAATDWVFINADVTATESSTASSYGNTWFADLGEGDDSSVIHTLAAGIGTGTVVTVAYDSSTLYGGHGSDVLQTTHYLSALNDAFASISGTSRYIAGGDGYDFINTQVIIESGRFGLAGGSANYSYNSVTVDAGVDGASIDAVSFISANSGGTVDFVGNSQSFSGAGYLNAGTSIDAGNLEVAGGAVNYSGNSLFGSTASSGGTIFAQNTLFAAQGGSIAFTDNYSTLAGGDGADFLSAGIGFTGGNADLGLSGGTGTILNNSMSAFGGAGSDIVDFYLNGWAEMGGAVTLSGNHFYGDGGEGTDSVNLNWFSFTNGGNVDISLNTAYLDGGAGADTLSAYLGETVSNSSVVLLGGSGDDYIQSIDLGQNNERVITGGAGNDTISDDFGFSTVVFGGAFSDYTLTALNGGWVSITDNRDGSPDGTDQLYRVDQLRFSDGDVLVSGLHLAIEGTASDDVLFSSDDDSIIYGYGGNDTLSGGDGNDWLDGGAGNDILFGYGGNDTLIGGAGNDQLIGNRGGDHLIGGAGADRFIFGALFQSTPDNPDLITDFSGKTVPGTNGQGSTVRTPGQGDKIDLSLIDANANLAGDQAFTIVQHGFSGVAGQAYSSFDVGRGITSLYLDVNGDSVADMTIELLGQVNLTGADLIL
jgi:RTX calcium-binding nonapeptide repeat (4 copies)